jgi:hypothetical protein
VAGGCDVQDIEASMATPPRTRVGEPARNAKDGDEIAGDRLEDAGLEVRVKTGQSGLGHLRRETFVPIPGIHPGG